MTYEDFKKDVSDNKVLLNSFYSSAHITPTKQNELKEKNFVPSYIWLMYEAYVKNIRKIKNNDSNYEEKKELFFKRAKMKGYKIINDFVIMDSTNTKAKAISVNDFESQFLKFSLFSKEQL